MRHSFAFALLSMTLLPLVADAGASKLEGPPASRKIFIGGAPVTRATCVIAVPGQPTPSEAFAAQELRDHLQKMTGETLEIVPDAKARGLSTIFVGKCTLPPSVNVKPDWQKLGLEGIHIETSGRDLVLAGGKRGVLYAVYSFLEDYLGCRWFTADCITIPDRGTTRLKNIRKIYVPALEYRDTDYPSRRPPQFSVRNKLNGPYGTDDEKWGGKISYKGFVHTFASLVPVEKYGKSHPEYYSELSRVRTPEGSQLCLTNPDVIRIATETVRQWMRSNPQATIFSVSQNDRRNFCECAKCTALAEKEGSQAGPLIHFVNAIADAVRDEFPDKVVDTLAYTYTRKPPRFVKPSPNVAVRLCSIECCFSHSLKSCPENRSFVEDIRGWNKLTNRLHIWDYVINYAHCVMPFPNLQVLKPNIQFFIDNGVTGIYEEANYFSKGGELAELRSYILAKTLWDPDYNTKTAIREFTDAFYGAAAPYIRDYIKLIHKAVCSKRNIHMKIYSPPSYYLNDPELIEKATAIFVSAEAAVADKPDFLHRVKVARLPVIYTQLALANSSMKLVKGALVSEDSTDAKLLAQFVKTAKAAGITQIREGGTFDAWVASRPTSERSFVLRTIRNQYLKLDVIPDLGGRIWRADDVRSGKQLIKFAGNDEEGYDPTMHGFEDFGDTGYRACGWSEVYRVLDSGPTFVLMSADLKNGLTLTRRIELLPNRPAFKVTSKLTSPTDKGLRAFRVHPAFAVNSTAKARVFTKNTDGTWNELNLANPKQPDAEKDRWLRANDKPDGQWAIVDDSDKSVILNTFSTKDVDFCYLNWNGRDARVNLEEWAAPATCNKTSGPTLTNTYELISLDNAPWLKK